MVVLVFFFCFFFHLCGCIVQSDQRNYSKMGKINALKMLSFQIFPVKSTIHLFIDIVIDLVKV